jgi:hypothetical protein
VLPEISATVRDIFAYAVVVGHRQSKVPALAAACGLTERTLEEHLHGAGQLAAKIILGWSTALSSVWYLAVLGWQPKRLWKHMAFPSLAAWAKYLRRHIGLPPAALVLRGGFTDLLDRFAAIVAVLA